MSRRSYALFLAGVFFTFLPRRYWPTSLIWEHNGPIRLAATGLYAGAIAVTYVLVVRYRPRFLPVLVGLHILSAIEFDRIFGPAGPTLAGEALRARLLADVNGATCAIVLGYILLSHVVRAESTRLGR